MKKETISIDKAKIQHIIDLLRFSLSLNDEEIIKTTVENIIEQLEEEIIN